MLAFRIEGLDDLVQNLGNLPKATGKNVLKRVLMRAAEPLAGTAARLAPYRTGRLSFSISIGTQLTRRQRVPKRSEVEVYVGPAGGGGALAYASFAEFGTAVTPAHPFMRSAWEATQSVVFGEIVGQLQSEVGKAVARAERKAIKIAAGG